MLGKERRWIGWAAVAVGVCAVVAAVTTSSTRVGEGFALGFGAFIAFFGMLTVLARNRRPDHWGLVVVGLAMFIVPFLGNGYTADPAASWTCWVAGSAAMVLGGIGWTSSQSPIANGLNRIGSGQALRSASSFWVGRVALVIGLTSVVLGLTRTNTTGTAVTIGLGGLMAVIGLWSLLAVDPTYDFLTLAITGFALFLSPWVAGFLGDGAAATAWVVGALVTMLGAASYLRGEHLNFAAILRRDAAQRYETRFR